jgi:hypothetical protein
MIMMMTTTNPEKAVQENTALVKMMTMMTTTNPGAAENPTWNTGESTEAAETTMTGLRALWWRCSIA